MNEASPPPKTTLRAVLFDLGGVVLGSPLHAIARFENEHGVVSDFVNRHVQQSAPDGAWHRLERGELTLGEAFFDLFDKECAAAGAVLSSRAMFEEIAQEALPRPLMLQAIARLKSHGMVVAALTNNWASDTDQEGLESRSGGAHALAEHFDHFLEPSVLGLRKPDPEIYRVACATLGVEPCQVVFLDDIGSNLKTARALGMTTIKVVEPRAALKELEAVVGFALADS